MSLSFLLNVGFTPGVSWPKINDDLNELNEEEKAGVDKIDLLERKQIIHNNIRRTLIQLDKDADNFIGDYMKKLRAPCISCKMRDLATICLLFVVFIVMIISGVMFKYGIISNATASMVEVLVLGGVSLISVYMLRKDFLCRTNHRISRQHFPEWFIYYLEARIQFHFLAQSITSSSHPNLFNYLLLATLIVLL